MTKPAPTPIPGPATNDPEKNVQEALAIDEVSGSSAIDPTLEKRVLRKLDRNLVPLVSVLYLLAFLDRSNIGKQTGEHKRHRY